MRQALIAATLVLAFAMHSAGADAVGIDEVRAGNVAFGAGRYEAAVESFTRGIQAGDLDPEALAIAFNNRGVAYGELGDFDNAIEDYGEALRLKPGDATAIKNLRIAHIRRGGAAATLGDADEALAEYGRAVELDPQHPLAYLRRGQLRLNRGDVPGAMADLESARRLDPENRDVAVLLEQAEQARAAAAVAAASPPARTAAAPAPPAAPPRTAAAPEPAAGDPAVPAAAPPPPPAPPAQSATPPAPQAGPPPVEAAAPEAGEALRAVADVNVRSGPGNSFAPSGMLARGTTVTALDQRLGWFRVRLPDGREGYIYRRWLTADGAAD